MAFRDAAQIQETADWFAGRDMDYVGDATGALLRGKWFDVHAADNGHSLYRDQSQNGGFVASVHSGDHYDSDPADRGRAEFKSSERMPIGTTHWASGWFLVEPGDPLDCVHNYIVQLHASEDASDISTGPILSIAVEKNPSSGDDDLIVRTATSTQNPLVDAPTVTRALTLNHFTRGIWHPWTFEAIQSHTAGHVKFWYDCAPQLDQAANIGTPDAVGGYYKGGAYNAGQPLPDFTVRHYWLGAGTTDLSSYGTNPPLRL